MTFCGEIHLMTLDHQAIAAILMKSNKLHNRARKWFYKQAELNAPINILEFDSITEPRQRAATRSVANYLRTTQVLHNYLRVYRGILDAHRAIKSQPIDELELCLSVSTDDPEEFQPCHEVCAKWLPILRYQLEERIKQVLQEYQIAHTICHQFLIKKEDPLLVKMGLDLFIFPD